MSVVQVAIYARVSSERQASEHTIASQVAALEDRVAADGFHLLPELRFIDDGYSGSTLLRPAMEHLRDAAASSQIDRLYVHAPDRLARSYVHQVVLVDELRSCAVELVFLNHPVGRSAEDELLLQGQGIIAEYERAKTLERSRRGKRHAAQAISPGDAQKGSHTIWLRVEGASGSAGRTESPSLRSVASSSSFARLQSRTGKAEARR